MENVYIAKLGKTVGLKGEIKIFLESDFPGQFKKDASFTTNKKTTLVVESFNEKRGVIKFKSIDSIETAKRLTNTEIYTTIEKTKEACSLDKDQYFWFDIQDCKIFENELELGFIKDIHRYPLGDYFEIQTSPSLVEKDYAKTFLLPYTKDYILEVFIDKKQVFVKDALAILENS